MPVFLILILCEKEKLVTDKHPPYTKQKPILDLFHVFFAAATAESLGVGEPCSQI